MSVKVSGPSAKATQARVFLTVYSQQVSYGSRHAYKQTDEVARNGAFGKILRPEVFPDAPLQKETPFVTKVTPLNIPTALPRRSSCKLWKLSGVLPQPLLTYPTEVPLEN
jgi:hypothetical protein